MGSKARQLGFTLSETLGVLAVVGIGLSLAVPGLQSITDNNRQATGINQLVSTLHLARSEAITRNTVVSVCASTDAEHCQPVPWEQGWIAFLDANGDAVRGPDEILIDVALALPGQELTSSEFPGTFSYHPDGRIAEDAQDAASATSGEFAFCAAGAEQADRIVIVRANGQPVLSGLGRDGQPAACRPS